MISISGGQVAGVIFVIIGLLFLLVLNNYFLYAFGKIIKAGTIRPINPYPRKYFFHRRSLFGLTWAVLPVKGNDGIRYPTSCYYTRRC